METRSNVLKFPGQKAMPNGHLPCLIDATQRITARVLWLFCRSASRIFQLVEKVLLLLLRYAVALPLGMALGLIYAVTPLFMFMGGVVAVMGVYEFHWHVSHAAQTHDLQLGLFGAAVVLLSGLIRRFLRTWCHDPNERVSRLPTWDRLLLAFGRPWP